MTTIVRRNQNWLPSMFNELFDEQFATRRPSINVPAINVRENSTRYLVEVAAPGMTKEDFNIRIDEDNNLVISLEKSTKECKCSADNKECECGSDCKCEHDADEKYLRREFSYSTFRQTMILPDDVDKDAIKANVQNGILSIELPKYTKDQMLKAQRVIDIE